MMPSLATSDYSVEAALEQFLLEQVRDGSRFFKSKYVAQTLEFSPHEIGAAFRKLEDNSDTLTVEQWAYTSGTTWKVTIE